MSNGTSTKLCVKLLIMEKRPIFGWIEQVLPHMWYRRMNKNEVSFLSWRFQTHERGRREWKEREREKERKKSC